MVSQLLLLAHMVVVCDRADALRPLAEEIAREEGIAVIDSWAGARSEYVVWVVEPGRLSDRTLLSFARAWRDDFPQTAVGVISGWTIEQARSLWRRGRELRSGGASSFDTRRPLARGQFIESITHDGYVTFAGHGAADYLRLDSQTILSSRELPPVPNLIIGTASCNVFRPWTRDSIALSFAERGAAAFAGFAYSPVAGFLIGGYDGLPFRYTWPEFPIGRVVRLQNEAAMRAFAAVPLYFLLGDPRIALTNRPAYRVVADETGEGTRRIELAGVPRGVVPVRVRGAAGTRWTEASGTAIAAGSGFYNTRLQTLDVGPDQYVLVEHGGGPLVLRLRPSTPWWWPAKRLLDALDNALIALTRDLGSCLLVLAVGIGAILAVVRRGTPKRTAVAALAAGALLASLHCIWAWGRLDSLTVTAKGATLEPLAILGTFVLTAPAAALFLGAVGWRGRAGAVLLATFPAWCAAALHLVFSAAVNFALTRRGVDASIYTYGLAELAASATLVVAGVVLATFAAVRRAVY